MTFLILSVVIAPLILSNTSYKLAPVEKAPWVGWYDDPTHEVYVSWETERATIGQVNYGTEKTNLNLTAMEAASSAIHHVNITGLDPGTRYFYEVEIDGTNFGDGEFKTAPVDDSSFDFLMIGDTQQMVTAGYHDRVAQAIQDKNASFVAVLGDFVDNATDKRTFDHYFHVASRYLSTMPIVPVIGNHDIAGEGEPYSESYFFQYFVQRAHANGSQFYFSFDYGHLHFTVLHFTWPEPEDFTEGQLDWIDSDLASAQAAPFRIVLLHCPFTGAGQYGPNEAMLEQVLPILERNNVSAIISGHEHHYERGHLGDILYFIIGGGGGLVDFGLAAVPSTEFMMGTPCYTMVHATFQELAFRTFTPDGILIDAYMLQKGGA